MDTVYGKILRFPAKIHYLHHGNRVLTVKVLSAEVKTNKKCVEVESLALDISIEFCEILQS
jgi:hypothetical protein